MSSEEMRAGDGDRQAVADRLQAALDEGRLDLHEYDERLQQAYAARTYGELERVTADLPARTPPADEQKAADRRIRRQWLLSMWGKYVPAVAICVVIWVISGLDGDGWGFWPLFVAGPWGLLLLWNTITGLSNDEPYRWNAKRQRAKGEPVDDPRGQPRQLE